jgi:multiple sugar transport system permease protein
VVAGLPTLFLLVTSLTPGALVNPGSLLRFLATRCATTAAGRRRALHELAVGAGAAVALHGGAAGAAGHGLALLVHAGQDRWKSLRHLFVIPMVLPPIVVAVIWKLVYTPDISPIYQAAKALGVRCRPSPRTPTSRCGPS